MISMLHSWLLGVVLTSFAVGMAQQIVPKGRERAWIQLIGGLLLTLSLLKPLGDISWKEPAISVGAWRGSLWLETENYRDLHQKELAAIIAEKLETYIWDKAVESGLEGEVAVSVCVRSTGIPLPETVSIGAPFDPALAAWLEEVVGIPAEKQIWQEGKAWTTVKDSVF